MLYPDTVVIRITCGELAFSGKGFTVRDALLDVAQQVEPYTKMQVTNKVVCQVYTETRTAALLMHGAGVLSQALRL